MSDQTCRLVDPETLADWDQDAIWVQNNAIVRVDPIAGDATGAVIVTDAGGETRALTRSDLQARMIPLGGPWFKPRYRPCRAICVGERLVFRDARGQLTVAEPGGAILRSADGSFSAVSPVDYALGYVVVGRRGAPSADGSPNPRPADRPDPARG